MGTWLSVVEQVGVTFCCLAALGIWITKYIKTKDDRDARIREQEIAMLLKQQDSQKEYFMKEIGEQRLLFTNTINAQNKIYSDTVEKFNEQLQNLTNGLSVNKDELKIVHTKLDKVEDDIKEIKYMTKSNQKGC